MSNISHTPTQDPLPDASDRQTDLPDGLSAGTGPRGPATPARLRIIHDLVRSGDYHIPATAIADRMIEQMATIEDKRAS